ncbi:anti-restriction protein [Cyanophage SS120-1]|uniref:DNA primase n=1 Tax=Cyanophage SS120-1 TaxID=616674 RepID=M1UGR4_9CAUD|nr:anti-restriction protein [Cyanophage SS120-1]AGG54512.1 DNA primase [Cyanophage SS120-1]
MSAITKSRKTQKKYSGPSPEEKLCNELVEALKAGVNPWRKDWVGNPEDTHRNLITGHEYQGANVAVLEAIQSIRGYKHPLWLGVGAAKQKGWFPQKGSKGAYILRPQLVKIPQLDENDQPIKDELGKDLIIAFVKYKTACVFNVDALKGIDEESQQALDETIKHQQRSLPAKPLDTRCKEGLNVLNTWSSDNLKGINHGGNRAFYSLLEDSVTLPEAKQFKDSQSYLATWAHELVHSTGHESRLKRKELNTYHLNKKARAREELVAELGAFLVTRRLKVNSDAQNHAAYLGSWAELLDGPQALFKVLSDATKASNFIVGPEVKEEVK